MRHTGILMMGVMCLACAGGGTDFDGPAETPRLAQADPAAVPPSAIPVVPPAAIPAAIPAAAEPVVTGTTLCRISGLVFDKDPAGLNVRATPSGRVLGQIPYQAMVQIDRVQGRWFHLTEVWHPDDDDKQWALGWVHGSKLGTWVKDQADYGPNMVAYLYDGREGNVTWTFPSENPPDITYLGCDQDWVQVKLEGTGRTGWLHPDQHCPNAVTNCS